LYQFNNFVKRTLFEKQTNKEFLIEIINCTFPLLLLFLRSLSLSSSETYYNEQGSSGAGKISSDNWEIFRNLWNAAFTTAGNWSLSWVKWDQTAPYHISL